MCDLGRDVDRRTVISSGGCVGGVVADCSMLWFGARRYDSTHGKFQGEVVGEPDALVVNGNSIKTFDKMCAARSAAIMVPAGGCLRRVS